MQFKESLSEACGECRCRFCNTTFCTSQFSCKTRQEVVLCLFRCQNGNRRKYAECIRRKEDNFLSSRSRGNRTYNVVNMINRIGNTGIFCYALIVKINLSVFIQCNIFQKCVTFDCIIDIRFGFFIQVNNLCIASAFKVKYTVIIPAVFVITNKETFRVCGKCCLTCTGKTEEDSGILAV